MREALLIVPTKDNSGHDLRYVRDMAVAALVGHFGGCTVSFGRGHWTDDAGKVVSEPVYQLMAACEPTDTAASLLRSVARLVLFAAKQSAVYLRLPSGDVELVTAAVEAQAAA